MSLQCHLMAGLLLAMCCALLAAPAPAAPALHVIPFPGTPDASPLSRVIFSSLQPSQIKTVIVTGSHSGRHTGHLRRLPDRAGTAFVPDHPFSPGEHVSVTAGLNSRAAAAASGDPAATSLRFSFTVAAPPSSGGADTRGTTSPTSDTPTQHFRSAPNLHPPVVTATADPDTTSGDIFVTPRATSQGGAMILDPHGRLIWFRPVTGAFSFNLEVQRYHNQPVLTWWNGNVSSGHGIDGQDVIMNRRYQIVKTLHGGYGYSSDLHEFQISREGTALIDDYVPIKANLTSVGGAANATLVDGVIQELDVRTGQVLWEWHALGHVPLKDTYSTTPYDFIHLNSIQELPNGNLLISGKDTWAVYEINKQTGRVIWTLGGKDSSFHMGAGTQFEWQHDARLSGHTLSVFDDASNGSSQEERQSSAKVLRLNVRAMRVSLVHRYNHFPPLITSATGSAQVLPDHNVFVGWGWQPDFSEYTAGGKQIFNGSFPLGVRSYRAYRFSWDGRPRTRPSVALSPQKHGSLKVYASWNGAAQVGSWRVLGGRRSRALRSLGRFARSGFETVMVLHSKPRYVAVQALDHQGKVLGTSRVHAAQHA